MAYTEAQKRATAKWNKENYSVIPLNVRKAEKEIIKEIAKEKGLSVNGYITNLIKADNPERFKNE